MLRCPLCHTALTTHDSVVRCSNGHAFDVAKEGYLNLTIGHSIKSHGDDPEMVLARRRFLSAGHYAPLKEALLSELANLSVQTVVDLGCGEGDYTQAMADAGTTVIGIDLSKAAIKRAAKGSSVTYVIANLTQTPLTDRSADVAVSIFSPFDVQEVQRISRRWFVVVRPLPNHLIELKNRLYPQVRLNPMPSETLDHLRLHHRTSLEFQMELGQPDLSDLLAMTPYVHTSPVEGIQRVTACPHLRVTAAFALDVFETCTEDGKSI